MRKQGRHVIIYAGVCGHTCMRKQGRHVIIYAGVVELADTLDLGSVTTVVLFRIIPIG